MVKIVDGELLAPGVSKLSRTLGVSLGCCLERAAMGSRRRFVAAREILPLQCLANPSSRSPFLEGFDQVATRPDRQLLRPRGLVGESCH
jgi:hypothetical protein